MSHLDRERWPYGGRGHRGSYAAAFCLWKQPNAKMALLSIDKGAGRKFLNHDRNASPPLLRGVLLGRAPRDSVSACAAGLEQYSAGVEPESGHVLADLVFGGDGFGACVGVGLAEEEGAGEQEAAGQPGGFFFLFGVAGDERVAGELLDFPDVMIEQDMGEFVAYIALGAPVAVCVFWVVVRVVDGDGPAVGQVEGGCGERTGLEPLEFFEAGAVHKPVGRDDFDIQVRTYWVTAS
jgi:hypothetical protein